MSIALATHDLVKNFGGLRATDHVSLTIHTGARHALIGPNGAGKTTLINLLTGVLTPSQGSITLEGDNIIRLSQHARVQRGLVRTFQINQLFADMSPLQSLCLAVSERHHQGRDWWRVAGSNKAFVDEAEDILARFGLRDVMTQQTRLLPYGKQRLLEIALAIACKPRVLLLDEPAAGVPEEERHEIIDILADLPKDVTVVLIEHDMDLVFSFADRISVLVNGALLTEGGVDEIARDPQVRAVYLGESGHELACTARSPHARASGCRLWRGACAQWPVAVAERRPLAGFAGSQRDRQNHADQFTDRPDHMAGRADPVRRAGHHLHAGRTARP